MARLEQIIQFVRNKATVEAQSDMLKKSRASVIHTGIGTYEEAAFSKEASDRICEAAADAAERRLVNGIIALSRDDTSWTK